MNARVVIGIQLVLPGFMDYALPKTCYARRSRAAATVAKKNKRGKPK